MSMSCFQKLFGCASSNGEKNKLKRRSTKKKKKAVEKQCKKLQNELKSNLAKQGKLKLNKDYTEPCMTDDEDGDGEVCNEPDTEQMKNSSKKSATKNMPLSYSKIFETSSGEDRQIRTVMTKGVAGIGKTVSVQKFILDWSEGKANQDLQFIFPVSFRDLNSLKGKTLSLIELLNHFFKETKETKESTYDDCNVLFIFDGLDECEHPLNFKKNETCCDVRESASVDVLLTNLIKGKLLPYSQIWITSRPAAANCIPPQYIDYVIESHGFSDLQKEEFLKKKIHDKSLAMKVIEHIKSNRSLYAMCNIPEFCWISATVLEKMEWSGEMPKTITQMYGQFLAFQEDCEKGSLDPLWTKDSILSIGKLAFQQLDKCNQIFFEEDLKNSGIDVSNIQMYSGVLVHVFENCEQPQEKVFNFKHPTVQAFLAALYVFLTYRFGVNLMSKQKKDTRANIFYKGAVDKALKSERGHLDLFLRFLLGLSLESNQSLLNGFLTESGSSSKNTEEITKYIKEKIQKNPSPESCINLFLCLTELNDHSLVEDIQIFLDSGRLSETKLSGAQWRALVFVLLTSGEALDEFDLKKLCRSEDPLLRNIPEVTMNKDDGLKIRQKSSRLEVGLLRLLPVVKVSRRAALSHCNLTERSCGALVTVLSSNSSLLKELDLNINDLEDSGVKRLSSGLTSIHCKLETLGLNRCNLTVGCCESLASVLSSNSQLINLDLSDNNLQDSGVKMLCAGLAKPECKLQTLRLSGCLIKVDGFTSLNLALLSNPSNLK